MKFMSIKDKINNTIVNIANKVSGVSQEAIDRQNEPKIITEGIPELARNAAAEGAVLLKNDGVLPLKKGSIVSLFGRVQYNYFYVGYGSGGDVNRPYQVNLIDGIKNCDSLKLNHNLADEYEKWCESNVVNDGVWGRWPFYYPEMPVSDSLANKASNESNAAVVVIGRSSGEDRDCKLEKGSYYLTDEETELLDTVTRHFDKTIVLLNVGIIIDMSWVKNYGDKLGAIMYVWQGGMESGNAIADLLCGKVNPSGRLCNTIAKRYEDFPAYDSFGSKKFNEYTEDIFVGYRYFESFAKDKVLYPFGFGLSYTDFEIKCKEAKAVDNGFEITATVTNTGSVAGKEVVQAYLSKPCGKLGNPKYELGAFAKTKILEPQETQELTMFIDLYQLTSYDDCGSTNYASAYVIEKGEYTFSIGKNVEDLEQIFSYYQSTTEVYAQHKQAAAPQEDFSVFHAEEIDGELVLKTKKVAKQKYDLGIRIMNNIPDDIPQTGNLGFKLEDVKAGKVTMEQFVAQLGLDELEAISRGDYKMDSPLGAKGNAGAIGGVLESLRDKGIPAMITTDGPSGIRLRASCSLLPIGTLLSCSFNTEMVEELYSAISGEMKDRGSDILLGPGMNIHRNPQCGRNFEYFSEDPYITGKMAAAMVKGVQSQGGSACPKHFACNNQEYFRTKCDSRLSERALREIYLKGFEICIKEAKPKCIMTSYNKINGVWGHYNYDLCTSILRNEWGYEGLVMTDWWMQHSKSPEFPSMSDQAYRVRAQVDVFMPGGSRTTNGKPDGTLLRTYKQVEGITLGEMQRTAMNVLNIVMDLKL